MSVDHVIDAPYVHATGPHLSRFFTALRDHGVILGARCERCEKTIVPPTGHCELCGGALGELAPVGPGGVVTGVAGDYVRVRLDGADTDLLHLGNGAERGARVVPVWAAERTGTIRDIAGFAPAAAAPTARDPGEPVTVVRTHLDLQFRQAIGETETRFRAGIARGEILANACPGCRQVHVPPRPFCPACFVPCGDWRTLPDAGAVTTFVVVNVPFSGQEIEIPYVLGHVKLDGADATFFHLVGVTGASGKLVAPPGGARAGMRVRAVWRPPAERRGLLNDDIDHFEPSP